MFKYSFLYIIVFLYVIAALGFWGYSLYKQDKILLDKEKEIEMQKFLNQQEYTQNITELEEKHKRKTVQYIAEGSTFFVIILIGAIIVFYSFKKRLEYTQQQNNFMLSITHELKTPIAGIKLSLETLSKRSLSEEQKKSMMGNSILEADRLNELCNNILISTQIDANQSKSGGHFDTKNFTLTNIAEILNQTVTVFEQRFPGITFHKNFLYEGEILLVANPFLWQLIFNNLIENAVKYSNKSMPIEIESSEESKNYVIKIKDSGIGIPDSDKKKIFQKFYRVGQEDVRKFKGTGLGLYIVKRAIDVHHCSIHMADHHPHAELKGNIAIILIPKNHGQKS